jgi:hypothetical protein
MLLVEVAVVVVGILPLVALQQVRLELTSQRVSQVESAVLPGALEVVEQAGLVASVELVVVLESDNQVKE